MTSKETVLRNLESTLKAFFDNGLPEPLISADRISRWKRNSISDAKVGEPLIAIVDAVESIAEVTDAEYTRYLQAVRLDATVKTEDQADALDELNEILANIQVYCESNLLGDNCLSVQFRSTQLTDQYPDENFAQATAVLALRYLRARTSSISASATPVWGTSYIEAARALLYARLVALVAQMDATYYPRPSEVHDHHLVAALRPNAITIGLDHAADDPASSASGPDPVITAEHDMIFSIRVHTDYADGWQDEHKQARLLESIENKLRARVHLVTGSFPRIWSVGPSQVSQSFEDTRTIGGSITVAIRTVVDHTQE